LCHTGLVWKSTVDGRRLVFHLSGINNQNFIMQDEQTGTWWQQVSGCALQGPLKGRCLEEMAWDEVTFAVFKKEHPRAQVLRPVEESQEDYADADWETKIAEYPTVTPIAPDDPLQPRDLVVGVALGGEAAAYPWAAIAKGGAIADIVGGTPILVLLHPDGRSLRCFDRRLDGDALELLVKAGAEPPAMIDDRTGSVWDFAGLATAGPLAGRRLARVTCLKDYWFDWKGYNPATRVVAPSPPH
jgi:hypothetical protein